MKDIVAERTSLALAAVRRAFAAQADGDSVALFVAHHLEELPADYWREHAGADAPASSAVLELLQLREHWGNNELEHFDFTLPGDVTDYVVSVRFNESGEVEEISMES